MEAQKRSTARLATEAMEVSSNEAQSLRRPKSMAWMAERQTRRQTGREILLRGGRSLEVVEGLMGRRSREGLVVKLKSPTRQGGEGGGEGSEEGNAVCCRGARPVGI